ncbi:hypothetical protein IC575_007022 [Cucumis melo]
MIESKLEDLGAVINLQKLLNRSATSLSLPPIWLIMTPASTSKQICSNATMFRNTSSNSS